MPGRILIAEEQQECCELFKQFFECCDFEVTAVQDGMSCVEALQNGDVPDVLILSWELPWGEGEGVLDWLQHHDVGDFAVVVLTARMDPDSRETELSLPDVCWLQRPFRMLDLLAAVNSTERVPRNNWRCVEARWSNATEPARGELMTTNATSKDVILPEVVTPD